MLVLAGFINSKFEREVSNSFDRNDAEPIVVIVPLSEDTKEVFFCDNADGFTAHCYDELTGVRFGVNNATWKEFLDFFYERYNLAQIRKIRVYSK